MTKVVKKTKTMPSIMKIEKEEKSCLKLCQMLNQKTRLKTMTNKEPKSVPKPRTMFGMVLRNHTKNSNKIWHNSEKLCQNILIYLSSIL